MSAYNYGRNDNMTYHTRIYRLRREGLLDEARELAESFLQTNWRVLDDDDMNSREDVLKAYAWTLIDIVRREKEYGNMEEAMQAMERLEWAGEQLDDSYEDEFVEKIFRTINSLSKELNPHFKAIQEAKRMSENGDDDGAMALFADLCQKGKVPSKFHEDYGWVIYRYLKNNIDTLDSVQVRSRLRDYLQLQNERPSRLHSMILNFALNYSKKDSNFRFVSFLQLWGADNIRIADFQDSNDGLNGHIPSLMDRIARVVVNYPKGEIKEFADMLPFGKDDFMEMLHEQFFWKLYRQAEKGIDANLWALFDSYLEYFSDSEASYWNSKVLALAERHMDEGEHKRFYRFFKRWNPARLRDDDWKPEKNDKGDTFPPMALQVIKTAKEAVIEKGMEDADGFQWLLDLYAKAVELNPDDEWILRSKAMLHIKASQPEEAKAIYKKLVFLLADKYYIWKEFAECFAEDCMKVAMLCKALSLESNDDFVSSVRIDLARVLIRLGRKGEALYELNRYCSHYKAKRWHLDSDALVLMGQCSGATVPADNSQLYADNIAMAESEAYSEVPYTDMVFVGKEENGSGKKRMRFVDGAGVSVAFNVKKFPALSQAHEGQVWKFKLFEEIVEKAVPVKFSWQPPKNEKVKRYVPLLVVPSDLDDWSILPADFGYVDYVNTDKRVYHIYAADSTLILPRFDKQKFKKGDFVKYKRYSTKGKVCASGLEKSDAETALPVFKSCIVAVDDVNEEKQLFHYEAGATLLDGIVRFSQTDLRPKVGDLLKIIYYIKTKDDKKRPGRTYKRRELLKIDLIDTEMPSLVRVVEGNLEIKHSFDFSCEEFESHDFAFVDDCYVSDAVLSAYGIDSDCYVKAKVVYTGDGKWKVFEILEY